MKTCETCGAEFTKPANYSRGQWEARRFCNRLCAAARLRKPWACACGCDERPLPKRKYVKGHRPLKLMRGYRRVWRPGHPQSDRYGMALEHRVVLHDAGIETAHPRNARGAEAMTAHHERQLIRALAVRLELDRHERDELIRRARRAGVPVVELAADARLSGSRIYQVLEAGQLAAETKGSYSGKETRNGSERISDRVRKP